MLTNNEVKMLRRMENIEKWKIPVYIVSGMCILIGLFFGSAGLISNEISLKLLGFIWIFMGIIYIGSTNKEIKLFRIIKKLRGELEQQKNPTIETK